MIVIMSDLDPQVFRKRADKPRSEMGEAIDNRP
jgi:hypothetical protein